MKKTVGQWVTLLCRVLVFHAWKVTLLGALLGAVGGYYSVLLYKNLRTDIEELLPTSARSVRDLNEVANRLRVLDNIVVLVFSKDKASSKRFVLDLAKKLQSVPKDVVSLVEYRIDKELQFFQDRRALYIELPDLIRIRDYISKRIAYEKELYNPLNIFNEQRISEPTFDYEGLKAKYANKLAGYDRFPAGFYATPDESVRALIVYMPGKGLDKAQNLKRVLEESVAAVNPKAYAPDLEVKFTGNGQNLLEESAALVEDLELSTVVVMILVSLAMIVFYRSFWATFSLVGSLVIGTLWTFGVSYFAVGYLNANTAFLASIVLGNGINFGIILLARYLEERRLQIDHFTALRSAMVSTAPATVTASLAAALSYGSLMLTGFRGFSQFGVIGLIGMVLCWMSAYTLLPAYLSLLERWFSDRWIRKHHPQGFVSPMIAAIVSRIPRTLWALSLVGVVLSFSALKNYKTEIIETDLSKLRDKRSIERGSGALYHYIDDIFGHSFSPMVILPKERGASRKIASLLKERRDKDGKNSTITLVQTLDDFIPKQQKEKIAIIGQIQRMLPARLLRLMPEGEIRRVQELLNPKAMVPFDERALPSLILEKFTESDGTLGKIVLVDKLIEKGKDDSTALVKFVQVGREITDSVAPNTPVVGDLPISFDMFQAITTDGPKATLFAFIAVVILVILLFPTFKTSALVLFSLGLGITWLGGLIFGFNLKINFLNFIALPITFGIGVDYGVNIFQRYREEGAGSILRVIRSTGGAVMLCSLTTSIGYGSLMIAGNQAFVSFGRLAILGELTCVTAAVIALPAFLEGRRKKT